MGEILMRCYRFVGEKKGVPGRIKLAQKTNLPSTMAAMEPDSQEKIE